MMNKIFSLAAGAALLALAGTAHAGQPLPLSDNQMDRVTAGWSLLETDVSNTSITMVSVYQTPNTIACDSCYLLINTNSISVGSAIKGGLVSVSGQ